MRSTASAFGGPSPLARGTHAGNLQSSREARSIPARAGNTLPRVGECRPSPVHPRSRWEHHSSNSSLSGASGPSPLARGTLRVLIQPSAYGRSIPARAGNTKSEIWVFISGSVHPRSRGEHQAHAPKTSSSGGPSPLARGTHRAAVCIARGTRSIPARAGNTNGPGAQRMSVPVHPRSRGEHAASAFGECRVAGPSPLARGTPGKPPCDIPPARSIPARAGNTPFCPSASCCPAVHPRSRGEHHAQKTRDKLRRGPSPLARGTR